LVIASGVGIGIGVGVGRKIRRMHRIACCLAVMMRGAGLCRAGILHIDPINPSTPHQKQRRNLHCTKKGVIFQTL
jgi:hypothetical protein